MQHYYLLILNYCILGKSYNNRTCKLNINKSNTTIPDAANNQLSEQRLQPLGIYDALMWQQQLEITTSNIIYIHDVNKIVSFINSNVYPSYIFKVKLRHKSNYRQQKRVRVDIVLISLQIFVTRVFLFLGQYFIGPNSNRPN